VADGIGLIRTRALSVATNRPRPSNATHAGDHGGMRVIFESLTASAARAMKRADLVARQRNASLIDPLDLLAALAADEESRAAALLVEFGIEIERLTHGFDGSELASSERSDPEGESESGSAPLDLLPASEELRLVLSEAVTLARALDRTREVGTEHLLAGLLATSGPAAKLLEAAGLELAAVRERLTLEIKVESTPLPLLDGIPHLELSEPGDSADLGRILDASANRAREGLRVVEDYVRFVLDDPGLTRRFKEVRHRLAAAERGLDAELLLGSRDTRDDVGTHIMTTSEQARENPRAVLAANFKRVGEALRSLEEYAKLVDVWLAGRFEVLRYDIYTLEKLTMTAVATHRILGDAKLMILIGGLPTLGDLTWLAGEVIAGGADVIQYRDKNIPDRELLRRAREVRILTAQARIPLILNDRADLSRLARSEGVHLGQEDLAVRDARRIVGPSALVGVSTHDREQLEASILAGASYLGVGPVFPSPTKEFSEPELAGLNYLQVAAETTNLPWFAIGGINENNLDRVLDAGATRIAVSSAVVAADSPREATERLKARLNVGQASA
jgi:thiamine-phosphate pyrophosphorylase